MIFLFCTKVRPMISFLVVFPEDMLLRNGRSWIWEVQSFFSPHEKMCFEYGQLLSVSKWLHCRPSSRICMVLPADPSFLGTLSSAFPSFFFPFLVLCIVECVTLRNAKVTNLFLSSIDWHLFLSPQVKSSSPAHSVATLSQTHPRLCQPTCVSTLCGCSGLFSFELPVWTATILCFSI